MPDVTSGYAFGSIPDSLMPLVTTGYKALAARAIQGVEAWYSTLSPETRERVSGKLAALDLSGAKLALKLSAPSSTSGRTLFVAKGGAVEQMTVASGLLENVVGTATEELSALAATGNVAGINLSALDNLFFSLDYGTFNQQTPLSVEWSVQRAVSIAVSYYAANGGQEFVQQLGALSRLNQIKIVQPPLHVSKQINYTPDRKLSRITFNVDNKTPALLNITFGLRLLYLAASSVLALPGGDGAELRKKLSEVAAAHGLSPIVVEPYMADELIAKTVAAQLDNVSQHKGVEMLIANTPGMPPKWITQFLLAAVLDTIMTGKTALIERDKPYSYAIGLAELVG